MFSKKTDIEQRLVREIKFAFQHEFNFGSAALSSVDLICLEKAYVGSLCNELRFSIFGQSNIQTYDFSIEVPKDWFQALKNEKFPSWYLKRYPVKLKKVSKEVSFNHQALFPSLNWNYNSDMVIYTPEPINSGLTRIK